MRAKKDIEASVAEARADIAEAETQARRWRYVEEGANKRLNREMLALSGLEGHLVEIRPSDGSKPWRFVVRQWEEFSYRGKPFPSQMLIGPYVKANGKLGTEASAPPSWVNDLGEWPVKPT